MVPGGSLTVSRTEPVDGLASTSLPSRYALATAMNVLEYSAQGKVYEFYPTIGACNSYVKIRDTAPAGPRVAGHVCEHNKQAAQRECKHPSML